MTWRKTVFWGHLAAGLSAGLVLFSMSLSGLILSFEPQITAWAERDVRRVALPSAETARLPAETVLARAAEAKPGASPSMLTFHSDRTRSAVVGFGRDGVLYVNPYSGEVLGGESKVHGFMHQVEDWHRWFLVRDIGRPITGAASLLFSGLIMSGISLWWPRRWTWARVKRAVVYDRTLQGREREKNKHAVTGFWCLLWVGMTAFTGVIMAYSWANRLLFWAAGSPPPVVGPQAPRTANRQPPIVPEHLNALWARAEEKVSGWRTISARFARRAEDPVAFIIEEPESTGVVRRAQLTFDMSTMLERRWEPYESQSRGQKWRGWVRPLHTGTAWGIPGQVLAAVAAGGTAVLVWTGFSMAWRRFRPRVRSTR